MKDKLVAYINTNKYGLGAVMRRVIGFAMFFIAIGMILMMMLPNIFVGVLLVIGFLLLGYNFFCC